MCILVFLGGKAEQGMSVWTCQNVHAWRGYSTATQQLLNTIVRVYPCCMLVGYCVYVLGEELCGRHTARTHAGTRMSSRCLQYFITARHGWCPGLTQRAHSGVRTFTHRRPTSNPPNWPFPPALLCFIRGYQQRRSSSFVPETCRLQINVDKETGVNDKIMV